MLPVDHQERKRIIAQKAIEIIARDGMHAATIRRIAGELNTSTRAVTHYFDEKEELLHFLYAFMAEEGYRSFSQHLEDHPGDLIGCLLTMTPLDSVNRDLWRVYIGFWELARRDPHIAAELKRSIEEVEHLIAGVIADRNPGHPDRNATARHIIAVVNGISVQLVLQPDAWNADQARKVLQLSVEALVGPPAA